MRMTSLRVISFEVFGRDVVAIPKYRDLIRNLEQLVHLVGDVDYAFALGLQRSDDCEQMADLLLGQRGRRLVHDQHVGVERHRLGDFHHLPASDGELADLDLWIDVDVEPLEQCLGHATHLVVVDKPEAAGRFAANPDVLRHRHLGHQV